MSYSVQWTDIAANELADAWFANPHQQAAISAAAELLDTRLKSNGPTVGESRIGNRRVAFERPIGIYFSVVNGAVKVLHVWYFRRKST